MKENKLDILNVILQPYVLDILHALEKKPGRFKDLKGIVSNERTLSLKLSKLANYKLIEVAPLKAGTKYFNSYMISTKGRKTLKALKRMTF